MSDTTYDEAFNAKLDRIAAGLGADLDADPGAVAALSDQLGFIRNNPISEEQEPIQGSESTVTVYLGWGCDHEAQIILGRLATRGWKLVRA